jgi:hypothetical protein
MIPLCDGEIDARFVASSADRAPSFCTNWKPYKIFNAEHAL